MEFEGRKVAWDEKRLSGHGCKGWQVSSYLSTVFNVCYLTDMHVFSIFSQTPTRETRDIYPKTHRPLRSSLHNHVRTLLAYTSPSPLLFCRRNHASLVSRHSHQRCRLSRTPGPGLGRPVGGCRRWRLVRYWVKRQDSEALELGENCSCEGVCWTFERRGRTYMVYF